jgi:hypothetical protein
MFGVAHWYVQYQHETSDNSCAAPKPDGCCTVRVGSVAGGGLFWRGCGRIYDERYGADDNY